MKDYCRRLALAVTRALFLLLMITSTMHAQEIGFIERFALAESRAEVLKELIPGTEDYYFFHALHYQNTNDSVNREVTMGQWRKRFEHSSQREILENRQALIDYEKDPKATLAYLKKTLGLNFNHERERRQTNPNMPTVLDPELVSLEVIVKRALRDENGLGDVNESGIDWLMRHWKTAGLSVPQKRALLNQVHLPDYPDMVSAIAEDLARRESKGFGEFGVHRHLLLAQLDALAEARPELLGDESFVHAKLGKLRPGADVDLERDLVEKGNYLDRAWVFVSKLGSAFNSLKANLLHERLRLDQKRGVYDQKRFLTYLQLPRPVSHINETYLKDREIWRHPVDLNFDCSESTGFQSIQNDDLLVRESLLHFLTGASDYKPFAPYLTDDYLKIIHAEANIVAGLGDEEQWSSHLTPSVYQALKDRVDLDFDSICQEKFSASETVSLDLHVKNVKNLIVKIYEINTANYAQNFGRQINTDLNLDGLVPNEELSFDYDEGPFKRVKRHFTFEQLNAKRGVWVLEFIGNGKSSRALIRRGGLQYLLRPSSAGHALRILDGSRQAVPGAYVWMHGKRYDPSEDGECLIPFSNDPGSQPIVLHDGVGFAVLESLALQSEKYELGAGFYIDREELISGGEATLAVRPRFMLNGNLSDVELLENVTLEISSANLDGIESTSMVSDFKLFPHKESTHRFRVPERLVSLAFRLKAKVKNLSQGTDQDLDVRDTLVVSDIAETNAVADLFLSKVDDGYRVQLLGRTGEPLANSAIQVDLQRFEFRTNVVTTLKTDESGTIHLGAIDGVSSITATAANGRQYSWSLPKDRRFYPSTIHAQVGESIEIPVVSDLMGREAFSFLERAYGTYVSDRFDALSVNGDFVRLQGLPAGNYHLYLKEASQQVTIRVSAGDEASGFILSPARNLEKRNGKTLHLADLKTEGNELVIQLVNANSFTRVHLLASRFVPAFDAFGELGDGEMLEPLLGTPARAENLYVSGRSIGDEYRYIIERRYATKFPGNMLTRPGILLNPWAIRDTSTEQDVASDGPARGAAAPDRASILERRSPSLEQAPDQGRRDPHDLSFLANPGLVSFNVAPGETGEIRVKLADLGDCSYVRVLAVDPSTAVERQLALPARDVSIRDLRLNDGLNPKRHFTQQDQVTLLDPNKAFVIGDVMTTTFEAYDTLESVYHLLKTLGKDNSNLDEFAFILEWPELDEARKRELYSKYASHELSFFLQRKDPEFFTAVIAPYVANKKDKTFMDHYLLGHDLSRFLEPWRFAQLNVVERILMAGRLPKQRSGIARDVSDWLALATPEQRLDLLNFDIALGRSALQLGEDASALGLQMKQVKKRMKSRAKGPSTGIDLQGGPSSAFQTFDMVADAVEEQEMLEDDPFGGGARKMDRLLREEAQPLYRKLESTKEWAENNYYHLLITAQNRDLVTVNKFWNDFAAHDPKTPFISRHVAEASRNFTEMMLALAVLDLPFQASDDKDTTKLEDAKLTLKPPSPVILFHKAIREAAAAGQATQLLVSQNFFREGDRFVEVNGERVDKFVTKEFLTGVVYGCQIVVTNPTSAIQRLDLLQQIPVGAIPVGGSKETTNGSLRLESYQTHTQEYAFYFPQGGDFEHFPVHVSKDQKVVAFAEPFTFHVVDELTQTDTSSWAYVSQWGSPEEVITYLNEHNLRQIDLSKIAWRCRESEAFFARVIEILEGRHHYEELLYSYAIHHGQVQPLQQYLRHAEGFLVKCGKYIETKLVTIDPVERKSYQHLDYSPLVNARAYALGGERKILNDRFRDQYGQLMGIFSHRPTLDATDRMTLTVYLLLQDRIEEALAVFDRIDREALTSPLQYDYLQAYLALYREEPSAARAIADRYVDYPVDRWRKLFQEVTAQLDEIEGKAVGAVDDENREQQQNQLAAHEASLTFKVENRQIDLLYRNLKEVAVNYYRMDLEFLFSTNPFVSSDATRFSMIKPNRTDTMALDLRQEGRSIPLPNEFEGENVLVEIVGGGVRKAQAYYSNSLNLQLAANQGQLKVTHAEDGKQPLSKVYVKVYAEINGEPRFYKDGYTDLRGKFDYASLNTNELGQVSRFSILVISEDHGALVQEAQPPQR